MFKKIVCGVFAAFMLASMSVSAFAADAPNIDTVTPTSVESSIEGQKDSVSPRWNPFCKHENLDKTENSQIEDCPSKGQHVFVEKIYKCTGLGCNYSKRESWFSCGNCWDGDTV